MMCGAWVLQKRDCSGGTCSRLPVEWGGIPRLDSARARPKEINGQKSQDCVPDPGGLGRFEPHPCNESKHERGPCENQSGGSTLDGGEDTTGEPHADRGRRNALHDHKSDRPTEEPTTSRHEWTGEEVTTPYDGHPEVRTQRECNREGRLEVKEENHQERRGNRSPDWKGHDQDRPHTHGRERKPETTKIWRNLQATDCRKGNPPHGKRKIERDTQCERIVHSMGPECCSPPSWPPCTRCNPTTGECTTTPPH